MIKMKCFLFTLLFIILFSTMAYAVSGNLKNIKIDGNFSEWQGYPEITDDIGDTPKTFEDIEYMQYAADDDNIYLHIKRVGSDKYTYWNLKVVILNSKKGQLYDEKYYPDKKDRYPNQSSNPDNTNYVGFKAGQYDITVYYKDNGATSKFYTKSSIDGSVIEENVASVSKDGREFEVKLPLNKVGLEGKGKEVEFMLKSGVFEPLTNVDWVPEKPIIITKGSNAWQLFIGASIIFVSLLAYRKIRKVN